MEADWSRKGLREIKKWALAEVLREWRVVHLGLCLSISFFLSLYLLLSLSAEGLLCSVAQRKLHIGQPCMAGRLLRAKCWVNTGCVWGLELLCTSLLFSPRKKNTWALQSCVAVLQARLHTVFLPLLIFIFFPLSFCFSTSPSAYSPVCSSVSGLARSMTSPQWASRPLTLAWSLTSSSKPHPQVRKAASVCSFSSLCSAPVKAPLSLQKQIPGMGWNH